MNAKELTAEPEVTIQLNALERNLVEKHTEHHPPAGSWPMGKDILVDLNSQIADSLEEGGFRTEENREAMEDLFDQTETAIANIESLEVIINEKTYNEEMEL